MEGVQQSSNKENERLKFLLNEFNQCFSHMRHYDNIKLSLAKFIFSFYSAIATLVFSMEQFFYYEQGIHSIDIFLFFLLTITFLVGLIVIMILARNRSYFVKVARQVNSIRKTFLNELPKNGIPFKNFLDIKPEELEAFNLKSSQIKLISLVSLLNSVFLAFAIFFLHKYFNSPLDFEYLIPLLLFIVIISFVIEILYIKNRLEKDSGDIPVKGKGVEMG